MKKIDILMRELAYYKRVYPNSQKIIEINEKLLKYKNNKKTKN